MKKPKATKYTRGFTAQEGHPSDERAPKLQGMSYNDLYERPRSVFMSPPTGDTQEPRMSRWEGGPVKGPLARGGLAVAPRPAVTIAIAARPTKGKPMTKGKR